MKKSSREKLNLFFSAFLIVGFIVCSYFFMSITTRVSDSVAAVIQLAVYVLFGLLLFYATRVGEGVPVKRFSLIVLLVLDLPALLIIIASLAPNFPLHVELVSQPVVMMFASIALGYGIPYTFLSGFEMISDDDEDEEEVVVKGGIVEDLLERSDAEDEADADTEDEAGADAENAEQAQDDAVEVEDTADVSAE